MYNKEDINKLYRDIATSIDISDDMFSAAVDEYMSLGKWIDENTPKYRISIYPQGSFGLGTVVKPITDDDDYDLDLVCQFEEQYGLTAKQLKVDVIKPLLAGYKKTSRDMENKRRCWHVEYEDIPSFHMDVIPAYANAKLKRINITDHDEEHDIYAYIGSNPSGYIKWFFERCARQRDRLLKDYLKEHREIVFSADIEKIKRCKIKTPLQRVIQLLKRHRDIMFAEDSSGNKPISIIITTIAAKLYQEEDNIVDAMTNILLAAPDWINRNKKNNLYYIENPSYPGENFADKWNIHPERATAFFNWINQARVDLAGDNLYKMTLVEMGENVKRCFGDKTGKTVFSNAAEEHYARVKDGSLKVDPSSGNISCKGTIPIPTTRHYGE